MKLSLKEQIEQLVQTPAAPRKLSGSALDIDLSVERGIRMRRPIDAIKALRDGGLTLSAAKRCYEDLLVACELRVHLPGVEDMPQLIAVLASCQITAKQVQHAVA